MILKARGFQKRVIIKSLGIVGREGGNRKTGKSLSSFITHYETMRPPTCFNPGGMSVGRARPAKTGGQLRSCGESLADRQKSCWGRRAGEGGTKVGGKRGVGGRRLAVILGGSLSIVLTP